MCVIKLIDIEKYYKTGNVKALRGISLTITEGEYVYIKGPSGSGKSTLLHILGLLDVPTKGRYFFDGLDTKSLSKKQKSRLMRRHIGFVFQNFYLFPYLNVFKNVELPLSLIGMHPKDRKERTEYILNKVGLYEKRYRMPNELSGGETQRIAIARAVVKSPKLILADEPTGNLDSKTGIKITELLESFNKEGKTLVIITHNPTLAQRGERIISLLDGKIVKDTKNHKEI